MASRDTTTATKLSVMITFLFGTISNYRPDAPSPSVVPLQILSLLSLSSFLRCPIVPGFLGIYVSRYIECSVRRCPPANTPTFYPVFVFLSCAETNLEDAFPATPSSFRHIFLTLTNSLQTLSLSIDNSIRYCSRYLAVAAMRVG